MARDAFLAYADRLDVGVDVDPFSAAHVGGVVAGAVIEEAIAGDVVVEPDEVRDAGILAEVIEVVRVQPVADEPPAQRMIGPYAPCEQVEAEEPARVLVVGLVGERRRRVDRAEVLRLDEARLRDDLADRAHGGADGAALDEDGPREEARVGRVRVPVSVEGAEAGRRERFVDRRPVRHPRIAFGDAAREIGQARDE